MLLFISDKVCNTIGDDVYDCCSSSNQCGPNEGDCDFDSDCSNNLVCGSNNCPLPFPIDADCCKCPSNLVVHVDKCVGMLNLLNSKFSNSNFSL